MDVVNPTVATPVAEDGDVIVTPMLTASDRCDYCPAAAVLRVRLPSDLDLDFCAHDYRESELGLIAAGATVLHDDRAKLLYKPAV